MRFSKGVLQRTLAYVAQLQSLLPPTIWLAADD